MVFCAEHPEPLEGAEQFLTQVVDVPLLAFDASHLGVLDSLSQVSDTGLARRFQNIALTFPWAEALAYLASAIFEIVVISVSPSEPIRLKSWFGGMSSIKCPK